MRIALIGCGGIAESHLAALKKYQPGAQIFLMDSVQTQADRLASRWSVEKAYSDLDLLFSEARPESVHILTPPGMHFILAQKALRSGCHVLIEKPLTETTEEFLKLSQLAQEQEKLLAVDYSLLGMPVVRQALEAVESESFGRLISVHCEFACSWPSNTIPYGNPSHWAYSLPGGVLQNMADHPASLVVSVMDGVSKHSVSCVSRNLLPNDCPDLLQVTLENDDQIGSFTLSLAHGNAERRAILLFETGSIIVDMGRQLIYCTSGRGPQNFVKKTWSGFSEGKARIFGTVGNVLKVLSGKLGRDPGILNVVDNFYRAIAGKEGLLVDYQTALGVTKLLEAIWTEIKDSESGVRPTKRLKNVPVLEAQT
ncbi:Gfo/Idh/MocA family oxidoreductase [candidate division KSB1 bacterium]|nr:Gfo/Idh/MocA family oxidoreductase [candidate division KSB1 bacterium]NIR68855.1 Gfo/Idh/MocA family oxidoreductase [candidate division KSB1 bacterium]NIS27223.1 Gfo/Idh/MocA family oxidoreductase [candidate division KSB1 bacterium]NIT74108.1 Gfo/Idh/MocA family oxidoreductase [candidate division KSB1 bacterium]NIU27957.1 Gfo/Idh/MocA family oxidoreductase [candidate division KSB1 bacterium]